MTWSLRLNNDLPAADLLQIALLAEDLGCDQLWVSNDLYLRSAPVLMGTLAARTSRIRLGIAIMNPYSVHVSELAMTAATLAEVSGGRFLLGIGAGSEEFLSWAGLSRAKPLATTAQAVAALRRMLGHRDVSDADLPSWFGDHSVLRFEQTAPVPVYVGGMAPKMLAMAGRLADGALPLLYPPEHFATAQAQVHDGLRVAGRDPAVFDLPACIWVSLSDNASAARAALAEKLAYYGPSISPYLLAEVGLRPEDFLAAAALAQRGRAAQAVAMIDERMLRLGIAGDENDVIDRCRALQRLGAEHLSFGPPLGPDPLAAVRILGERVMPALGTVPRVAASATLTTNGGTT
ncbi:methylenetetrahydromethanopterin reductase [Nakamurella panacisegetis]|uniref:Methylenetetrahydromethanopterin reductase n=1 Tax=Nakamurella panacisegetis TaxID=1090615 RepID=A0A1H0MWP8_9ACTN|nr:LLM class flavin-dependent oxidoreductase [Nakamurella panacisegetis]SDO84827.1 methylenetetrahydromethanopterin reductase [Nakamurella panacisegetis]